MSRVGVRNTDLLALGDDRLTVTQVQPAATTLDVACWCGLATRKFDAADVHAGTCGFSCGRTKCRR